MFARNLAALVVALSVSTGVLVLTSSASAEPCAPADRDCAKRSYEAGTAAFDRGEFAQALAAFESARAANSHPFVSFNIALCLARLGRLLESRRELDKLLEDATLGGDLEKRVKTERAQVNAQLSRIILDAPSSGYAVEIDGAPTVGEKELELDPGEHHLRITKGEQLVYDQVVKLDSAERLRLRVTDQERAIDVVVVPEQRSTKASTAPSPAPAPRRPLSPVVFYAAASASVLLGGLTVWSGLDVQSAYDDYKRDLPHLTQSQADDRVSSGHARELRTNVLLGATALSVAATATIGLLWVDFGGRSDAVALGFDGQSVRVRAAF
ncbi:MAG TPA: hypothetical protein VFQ35_27155 [Polyangiaceae bacterium]|nr:hypothetical protein [Polyangiaceae bacterium]